MQERKSMRPMIGMLVFLFCLLLSGCNVSVGTATQMNIDSSFAGFRLITCTVEQSDDTAGAVAWLDSYLAEGGCPAVMSYVRSEDDSGKAMYQFRMDFASKDDYYNKVVSLLGRDVTIQLEQPDNVMASGIRYSEDFTSEELVQWTVDALVDSGTLPEERRSGLFSLTDSSFVYNGVEQECWGDAVTVDSLRTNSLDTVSISTFFQEDGTLAREIVYSFPYDFYQEKSAEIQAEFSKFVPEGAETGWNDEEAAFWVKFSAPDAAALAALTNTATGAQGNGGTSEEAGGEHLLSYRMVYEDTLDLSGLLYNTDSVYYRYQFFLEDGSKIMETARDGESGWYGEGETMEDSASFYEPVRYTVTMEKAYPLNLFSVKLSHKDADNFRREICLEFGRETPSDIIDGFFSYFEGQELEGVEIARGNAESGSQTAVFQMEGSAEEVSAASAALLGGGSITVTKEKAGFAKELRYYGEEISLDGFKNIIGYYGNVKLYLEMGSKEKLIGCRLNCDGDSFNADSDFTGKGSWTEAVLPDQPYEIGSYASVYYQVYYQNTMLLVFGILGLVLAIAVAVLAALFMAYKVCRAKGITADDAGSFIRMVLVFVWKWLKLFAAAVVYYGKNIDALGLPPGARKDAAVYFWGSKIPAALFFMGVLLAWIMGQPIILWVFILAAFVTSLFFRFRNASDVEQQIDAYIMEDAAAMGQESLQRLGFDYSQVSLIAPVQVKGPHDFEDEKMKKRAYETNRMYLARCMRQRIKDWLHYRSRQIYRRGRDGAIRYPLVQVTTYFFSEEQIYCYIVVYDLITGRQLLYLTKEYFYQDVNGLKIGETLLSIRAGRKEALVPMESFTLSTRSGRNEKATAEVRDGSVRNSLAGMAQLLRNKKMQ